MTDEVDATASARDVCDGSTLGDWCTSDEVCWCVKVSAAVANKVDVVDVTVMSVEPVLSGADLISLALVVYCCGSDVSAVVAVVCPLVLALGEKEVCELLLGDVAWSVTTGCLNAGKLISANWSSGEEWATALDAVGIMCDVTEALSECDG